MGTQSLGRESYRPTTSVSRPTTLPAGLTLPARSVDDAEGVAVISGPTDRDWGMRTMTFADPGGNTWEIAQELPDNGAS